MNCIFCKQSSDTSKSVEHIVPESLGNKTHTLPKGIVCDRCNNYFSNKIEKPLMDLPYFISVRNRNYIESKKGRIPVDLGVLSIKNGNFKVNLHADENGNSISFDDESVFNLIKENGTGKIIMPLNETPPADNIYISKLLGKIAIEVLTNIAITVEGGFDDVIQNKSLDLLRNYVRFGEKIKFWPYTIRHLYSEKSEILHEYQLFQTDQNIWHISFIMFGVEYCLNMCEPTISDYKIWLKKHNYKSPLY